jgi:hypothetical protein
MQTRMRQITLGVGLILAAGCAGRQVSTDYSPATGFSRFRTFAMVSPPDSGAQQLLDQRVRNAVQVQLDAQGLTETGRQKADLFVGYGMVDRTHKDVYTYRDRWGVAWPMSVQRRVETYTDGTVVVNLVDAKTKQVVWEGEVADVVNLPVGNPVSATRQIDGAVAKLFTKYPPQSPRV